MVMDGIIYAGQLQEYVSNLFALRQNGIILTTLAPGQNGFLLLNIESGFKFDSHLWENE